MIPTDATALLTLKDAQGRILIQVWTRGEAATQLEIDVMRERCLKRDDCASSTIVNYYDGRPTLVLP